MISLFIIIKLKIQLFTKKIINLLSKSKIIIYLAYSKEMSIQLYIIYSVF